MLRLRPTLHRIVQQNYGKNLEHLNGKNLRATSTSSGRDSQSSAKISGDNSAVDTDAVDQNRSTGAGIKVAPAAGKLRSRLPLVKNFFVGVVDKEMLGYPEVIQREEMTRIENEKLPLKNFFTDEVNNVIIDRTRQIPAEAVESVRQLGLYGINVPADFEGKGLGWTASLMTTEPESNCANVALGLLSHRVIIDVLKELGSNEQQQRFLPKLVNGSHVGVEAIFEYDVSETDLFNTRAEHHPESNEWCLSGQKAYAVTGPFATTDATPLFLVIAQTRRLSVKGDAGRGTTIFLVDGSTPGVKLGEQHLTIGFRGLQTRRVEFDQVILTPSSVLGAANEGNLVAEVILRSSRLRNAHLGLCMAKQLVNDLTTYCIENTQCNVSLKDMEMLQMHLSKASCVTYAIESMIYMTAGILDEFASPDVALETAITKYFSLTQLFKIASKSMDIIGPKSLLSGQATEVLFRDAAQLYTQGESMDTLRLFIALIGLQHAGTLLSDTVRMQRNPLLHPGHIFRKFLQNSNIDNPKTKMRLNESVHPTLEPAAQCIEHSVARLQMCVELLLTRYGSEVVEKHHDMQRVADIASTIYAMFASIARASRSYCIGLQLADYELVLASAVCSHGQDKVRTLCTEIFNGQYVNNDSNLQRLAKQVIRSKGYFPVHPLTYNY
ncbi:PREDICTED: acyl-CoA dehydrogenase family member 9, mitochondrial [Rhagoletis zephyria]|uniref:acyl-CoA dehydrogenase family member 9, mitochondrial n=1 Tax=Rhagoletis zephyria TaxID=28612 RepID=UPI0008115CEC|nr:PREDICTED: acyl-CoA dehydrogenase family member 9, mitochondrial [Rhagoletis zephyria]